MLRFSQCNSRLRRDRWAIRIQNDNYYERETQSMSPIRDVFGRSGVTVDT